MASWGTEPARLARRWTTYRQVDPRWPPLYHSAGEPVPSQESGRWHGRGQRSVQYLSLEPAGAWAEFVRAAHLRDDDRRLESRRQLWLVSVEEHDVADLSTFDHYVACGLDPQVAVGVHDASRALADELADAGYRGLLSPSAALPGAVNLSVFGERYEHVVVVGAEVWANPDPDVWLPCSLAAEGSPPASLLTRTCFIGAPHEGLASWRASNAT